MLLKNAWLEVRDNGMNLLNGFESSKSTYELQDQYTLHKCSPPGASKVKQEDMELYTRIRKQVEEEFIVGHEPMDYKSVTKCDFHKDLVSEPVKLEPRLREMVREQPITFWTEHRDKMHGNTHYSINRVTPFGRNAAFTTPIDKYLNSRMPSEMQVYPR
ncbi:unnamed protein product [Heterobilharzia americana]|nr:unnamed protein product [Heterobilharzia americana]